MVDVRAPPPAMIFAPFCLVALPWPGCAMVWSIATMVWSQTDQLLGAASISQRKQIHAPKNRVRRLRAHPSVTGGGASSSSTPPLPVGPGPDAAGPQESAPGSLDAGAPNGSARTARFAGSQRGTCRRNQRRAGRRREGRDAADVDLAQNISLGTYAIGSPEEEVGAPQRRQCALRDSLGDFAVESGEVNPAGEPLAKISEP